MRRYVIAIVVAAVLIGGMFAFSLYMRARMDDNISEGIVLSLGERALFALAVLWRSGWWLLSPFILALCVGVAAILGHRDAGRRVGKTS
jgi:hypothetical protein